jgi:divalent metal cation (Fe/Co/Zn/Cd) transporter
VGRGHAHAQVDAHLLRSRAGIRTASLGLALLGATATVEALVCLFSDSVALLSALIHNAGGALTAIPIGFVGTAGNKAAASVWLHAGRRLASPALIADGHHARIDGLVSLGVVAGAVAVGLGRQITDPLIGLAIALLILRIMWQAWVTVP